MKEGKKMSTQEKKALLVQLRQMGLTEKEIMAIMKTAWYLLKIPRALALGDFYFKYYLYTVNLMYEWDKIFESKKDKERIKNFDYKIYGRKFYSQNFLSDPK